MLRIEKNVGALVAGETRETLKALDEAILNELRLATTLMEAFDHVGLPVGASQKLLQSVANGIHHIVKGRGEMATTIRVLTAIKASSSLKETSYGCPGEQPPMMAARPTSDTEPLSQQAFG